MAFRDSLENIREKATEAAQIAAVKTKKLAEIAKSNLSIYSEEDKIKKAQTELGKLYYRDYVVGEDMDAAEYLPWCQKIDESKQTIADLRDYIEELKCEHVPTDDLEDDFQENLDVSEDDLDDFEPDAPAAEEVPELGNIVNDEPEAPAEE